jgi:hypothetical protein
VTARALSQDPLGEVSLPLNRTPSVLIERCEANLSVLEAVAPALARPNAAVTANEAAPNPIHLTTRAAIATHSFDEVLGGRAR